MSRLHRDDVYNRFVDTRVRRLPCKLETDPADPRYICTERGVGQLFGVAVETIY